MNDDYTYIGPDGTPYQVTWKKKPNSIKKAVTDLDTPINETWNLMFSKTFSGIYKVLPSIKVIAHVDEVVVSEDEDGDCEHAIGISDDGIHSELEFETGTDDVIIYGCDGVNFYLFLRDIRKRLFQVPLPNVYGDSGIFCMPEDYVPVGMDLIDIAENGLRTIEESEWNTDLQKDAFVRWDHNYDSIPISEYLTYRSYYERT